MTHYIQETDSKMVYAVPSTVGFSLPQHIPDETFGGDRAPNYLPLLVEDGLLNNAWGLTLKTSKNLSDDARRVLSVIQQSLNTFRQLGIDVSYLPELQGFLADDGSLLLEWSFNDYRIGFSIEPNAEESSWFLVANESLGEISASGFITQNDLKPLILWLLNFILARS
jgi:hypothetical protein